MVSAVAVRARESVLVLTASTSTLRSGIISPFHVDSPESRRRTVRSATVMPESVASRTSPSIQSTEPPIKGETANAPASESVTRTLLPATVARRAIGAYA